jgi:hypothetical protein
MITKSSPVRMLTTLAPKMTIPVRRGAIAVTSC